jgi:3-keto-disaccharide hydrolase
MKRLNAISAALLVAALSVFGCAQMSSMMDGGWTTLIDGDKGLDNFNRIGDANWRAEGGAIVADQGKTGGHLVTKKSYKDFQIKAEFYAETNTNSGIFIRISDPNKIGAVNSYEVNIYDQRPGQEYATGAIVNFGRVPVPNNYQAAGKWNTFVITAKGTHLQVVLNGVETVTIYDSKFASGPFSLQFGNHGKAPGGAIKWRKVEVKEL